jgi:ABC-type antimicrobial peptide transport system permease subunit
MREIKNPILAKLSNIVQRLLNDVVNESCCRFWIEPEPIEWRLIHNSNTRTYIFNYVKMTIKSHSQLGNIKNNIIYKKIAQHLTLNYDEICKYYPEFDRLKELYKLQAIVAILNKEYNVADKINKNLENSKLVGNNTSIWAFIVNEDNDMQHFD